MGTGVGAVVARAVGVVGWAVHDGEGCNPAAGLESGLWAEKARYRAAARSRASNGMPIHNQRRRRSGAAVGGMGAAGAPAGAEGISFGASAASVPAGGAWVGNSEADRAPSLSGTSCCSALTRRLASSLLSVCLPY